MWPQVTDLWKPVINTGIVDLAKGGNAWLHSAVSNVIIATALEDTLAASASAADTSSKKWKLEFLTSSRWPTAGQAWFHASQNHWLLSAWNYKTTDIVGITHRPFPPAFHSGSGTLYIPRCPIRKCHIHDFHFLVFAINVPPKCPLSKDGRHGGRTAWERDWWVRRWCGAVRLCSGQLNFANKIFEEKKNNLKIYICFIVWRRCKPTMHWMPHHLLLQQVSLSLYFNFLFIPFPLSFFSIPYIGYKCHSLHLLNLNDVLWFMEGLSPPLVPYDKFPYLFVR